MSSGDPSGGASSGPPVGKKRKLEHVVVTSTLPELCWNKQWNEAMARAVSHPNEARLTCSVDSSSPLALACRLGAPPECVRVLLDAFPEAVRQVLHCRGTPLHEAVVFKNTRGFVEPNVQVVQLLLEADAKLSSEEGNSACLIQDADGCTPLHLLIKWKFPSYLGQQQDDNDGDEEDTWFHLLRLLVQRAPQAVGLPDRGDYSEPPLVMALKANVYVTDGTGAIMFQRTEHRIRQTVAVMLEHYPQAVRQTLVGALGQYSALHSAAFHGRCADTIQLLLNAEQRQQQQQQGGENTTQAINTSRAALVANTHGECPLHFAAMRGEPPPSIELLADADPRAILMRDTLGLTPFHWLWTRFVSSLQAIENERGETTIAVPRRQQNVAPSSISNNNNGKYVNFASLLLNSGDLYSDLSLIRNVDPPVDFFRMRHIPPELASDDTVQEWADRTVDVVRHLRQRYNNSVIQHDEQQQHQEQHADIVLTRREAVTSLFWTKVVSLLKAASTCSMNSSGNGNGSNTNDHLYLVHAALACPSCPFPVTKLICSVFADELSVIDPSTGRLPLHNAACRPWHSWDWPLADAEEEQGVPTSTKFLRGESIAILQTAIQSSPPQAAKVADHDGRLVLHHVIDTFVRACSNSGRSYMVDAHKPYVQSMLQALERLVRSYPSSLERKDGKTKLYPFLQATAVATQYRSPPSAPNGLAVPFADEMPLSIVYQLLRENPSLVGSSISSKS